jgi:hypothetical protein
VGVRRHWWSGRSWRFRLAWRLVGWGPVPARPAGRERYLDRAIFPEDVDIPIDVLQLLWPSCRVDPLCEELIGLGLAADYRLDPGSRLVLHDVMRTDLQTRRNATQRAAVHRRLIDATAALLPGHDHQESAPCSTSAWTGCCHAAGRR